VSLHPLPLDVAVPPGGYAWWYLDVVADDGRHALTAIFFVGSVFSPFYARERARGSALAEDHCAVNIALHGPSRPAWVMTEWPRARVSRSTTELTLGASRLQARDGRVVVELDELTSPFPRLRRRPLLGRIVLEPRGPGLGAQALDAAGRHRWYPVAPRARARVELDGVVFEGAAYHDANAGDEPLSAAFRGWSWCRLAGAAETRVNYAVRRRDGTQAGLALAFDAAGGHARELPPSTTLPRTGWWLERPLAWAGEAAVVRELESSPFYARALVRGRGADGEWLGVHEALDLDRFEAPWVRFLLPFRMRRMKA
jgi:carotenoid 1,2-hydratase